MVGKASETGTLELLQKARGSKKSVQAAYDELVKAGYAGGRIVMAQRNNENVVNSSQSESVKPSHKRILKFYQPLVSAVSMQKRAVC